MKDERIIFRLTEKECERLAQRATEENVSESEFIRRKIEEGIPKNDFFLLELKQMVDEIGKEADRINEAAIDANINGGDLSHAEIAKSVIKRQIGLMKNFSDKWFG